MRLIQWSTIERRVAELSRTGDVDDRIGYLEHQLAELSREAVAPTEIDDLMSAHRSQSGCCKAAIRPLPSYRARMAFRPIAVCGKH